jgi:hypothetical protein
VPAAATGAGFGLDVVLEAAGDADRLSLHLRGRLGLDPLSVLEGVPLAASRADDPEAPLVVLDAELFQGIGELLLGDLLSLEFFEQQRESRLGFAELVRHRCLFGSSFILTPQHQSFQ